MSISTVSNDSSSCADLSYSVIGTLDEDLLRPPVILSHRVHEPLTATAVSVKQLRSNLNPLQHRRLNTDNDAKKDSNQSSAAGGLANRGIS